MISITNRVIEDQTGVFFSLELSLSSSSSISMSRPLGLFQELSNICSPSSFINSIIYLLVFSIFWIISVLPICSCVLYVSSFLENITNVSPYTIFEHMSLIQWNLCKLTIFRSGQMWSTYRGGHVTEIEAIEAVPIIDASKLFQTVSLLFGVGGFVIFIDYIAYNFFYQLDNRFRLHSQLIGYKQSPTQSSVNLFQRCFSWDHMQQVSIYVDSQFRSSIKEI